MVAVMEVAVAAAAVDTVAAAAVDTVARQVEAMAQFAKQGTNTVILPTNATPLVQVK